MQKLNQAEIEALLAKFEDPYTCSSWSDMQALKSISVDNKISINLQLPYPTKAEGFIKSYSDNVALYLQSNNINVPLTLTIESRIQAYKRSSTVPGLTGIKNIIAVASGKGGVGKSTTSVNLAVALQQSGAAVGFLDADIYGPSGPTMLGEANAQAGTENKNIEPIMTFGIPSVSIGFLVEQQTPMIWRGPMASSAVTQMFKETNWPNLDYLIVDLPPGTGDIQLTLAQKIPVTGVIICTTPQDLALLDARRAYAMFSKVKVETLGVVENMSTYHCPKCGHESHPFGVGGGARMARQYNLPMLGSVPLDLELREGMDAGKPPALSERQSTSQKAISDIYQEIALNAVGRLSNLGRDYSSLFGKVAIETKSPD